MSFPSSELVIDPVLIRKYDISGPRYTSYPTADRFVEAFGEEAYRHALSGRSVGGFAQPLSLYVHIPFCRDICFYCGCNKVITRDQRKAKQYIDYLLRELGAIAPLVQGDRRVAQMHWGGGTPTFLELDDMHRLIDAIDGKFGRMADCESSIEVDPRENAPGRLAALAGMGFNRVSLGVQDFDPGVQAAVHRIQPEELTRRAIEEARAAGFRSVNFDLIYGLPKQTLDTFNATLDRVMALDPDRIALYGYAHLPAKFKPQRRIVDSELPDAETKLQILTLAIGRLTRAGYLYIGMDHFAKPTDDLAIAQAQGRLYRNFQGYSTRPDCDIIGLGVSSIGRVGPTYSQNVKNLDDYYAMLDAGRLPVACGAVLAPDDLVRRAVIQALLCQFRLSIESIEVAHLVDFRKYFAREMEELKLLEDEGLVEIGPDWIVVTASGRLVVRAICMIFDRYLRERKRWSEYSKVL